MRSRVRYFDTLRLLAIVLVYTTHFIAEFHSEYFRFWTALPTSLVLNGLTGKAAVAAFAVILGFFAAKSGRGERSTLSYSVNRYLYFFLCGLFINCIYAVAGRMGLVGVVPSVKKVLLTSLAIGDDIFSTFWCMKAFLIGSVLCFVAGKRKLDLPELILLGILLYWMGQVWLTVCLLGAMLPLLEELPRVQKALSQPKVQLLLFVILFVLVKRKESTLTYLIDGICALLLLLILAHNETAQKVLGNPVLAKMGENCMAIYLLHPIVYSVLGNVLFPMLSFVPYALRFLLVYLLCLAAMIALAFPAMWIINRAAGACSAGLKRIGLK